MMETCLQQDRHNNITSSLIHNSWKWDITPTSINRRIDEHIVLYSYNGIILSSKRSDLLVPVGDLKSIRKRDVTPKNKP